MKGRNRLTYTLKHLPIGELSQGIVMFVSDKYVHPKAEEVQRKRISVLIAMGRKHLWGV
jgi:hypothetical protein